MLLPGLKSKASVKNSKVLLKSVKIRAKTLPGCNKLQMFRQV
jgi:hypothetical protein